MWKEHPNRPWRFWKEEGKLCSPKLSLWRPRCRTLRPRLPFLASRLLKQRFVSLALCYLAACSFIYQIKEKKNKQTHLEILELFLSKRLNSNSQSSFPFFDRPIPNTLTWMMHSMGDWDISLVKTKLCTRKGDPCSPHREHFPLEPK